MNSYFYQPKLSDNLSYYYPLQAINLFWTDLHAECLMAVNMNFHIENYWAWDNHNLMKNYWVCIDQPNAISYSSIKKSDFNNQIVSLNNNNSNNASSNGFSIVKRTRKNPLPDIEERLRQLLQLAADGTSLDVTYSTKCVRGLYHGVSARRSKYIGVLRNRNQWQVLINDGKLKKYIGTYMTELEAVVANDFYSIGIKGMNAKTNFSYSHSQVMAMIEQYFENSLQFDPTIFISKYFN